jgi:hypothetical protein
MNNLTSPAQKEAPQEINNYLGTYNAIGEWIRFADAKAAAALTVIAALSGLLIPTLKGYFDAKSSGSYPAGWWPALVVIFFVLWLLFQVGSGLYAFLCITPFRRRGRHPIIDHSPHFHPAGISHHYRLEEYDRFVKEFEQVGPHDFKREVMIAILIDAHISHHKYVLVSRSIRLLAVSVVLAFLYFLAIQF